MIFPKIEKAIKEMVYTLPVTCEDLGNTGLYK